MKLYGLYVRFYPSGADNSGLLFETFHKSRLPFVITPKTCYEKVVPRLGLFAISSGRILAIFLANKIKILTVPKIPICQTVFHYEIPAANETPWNKHINE